MDKHDLIIEFKEILKEIYKQEGLNCLRGINYDYTVNGKQILQWHNEVTRKCAIKNCGSFNYNQNIDDLITCSDEIMYFTGQLFLFRPYINNPLLYPIIKPSTIVYQNLQNYEATCYYMITDVVSEKLYNYWDRIGDLIASFFSDLIEPKDVFFPKIIQIIPEKYQKIKGYKWLKEFKENEYVKLNSKRKQSVHYITTSTSFKYRRFSSSSNKEETEKWVSDRNAIPDFFKNQIELTVEGLFMTLSFLEEVEKDLFKDVD